MTHEQEDVDAVGMIVASLRCGKEDRRPLPAEGVAPEGADS